MILAVGRRFGGDTGKILLLEVEGGRGQCRAAERIIGRLALFIRSPDGKWRVLRRQVDGELGEVGEKSARQKVSAP